MKEALKAIGRAGALVIVLPALISFAVRARLLGRDRALEGSSQALGLVPGLCGQYLRRAFLSRVLAGCHAQAVVGFGTHFSRAGAFIGQNAYVGPYCVIGLADIGRDVLIASGVQIPSGPHTHGFDDLRVPIREQTGREQLITIGAGAWIGNGAIVLADIGADAVVGAGSVVTRPIPDRAIAAGVPARVLRERGADTQMAPSPAANSR